MKETIDYLNYKLKANDTIIIGLSGGPDSMCLFNLLLQLKNNLNLKLICAHINHNVRKESEEEALFVKEIVENNNCIFECFKIDTYEQENFESYARKKRYDFYKRLVHKYKANYLMTAHHGDDLIETVLMRLVRGSHLKGYAGFKKETDCKTYELIRPLINITKSDIEEYNKKNNIPYCVDKSNYDNTYTRNRYRHYLLPQLKKENKDVHKKFLKFSEEMYEIEHFLEKETEKILTKVLKFGKVNLHEFNKLNVVLKKRVLEYGLKIEYQDDINSITDKHIQEILNICNSKKANLKINLPKNRTLIKSYDNLYIEQTKIPVNMNIILKDSIKLNDNQQILKLTVSDIKKSNYIIRLNSQEIDLPLYIRNRKKGDYIEIKNLNGKKKVKDIFIDEKISLDKRDSWPILVDSKGRVLWLLGLKKSKFDKNIDEFYDIIYKYVISEER